MKLLGLDKDVRDAAKWSLKWAKYYGVPVTVTSGKRSWANQVKLRRNYENCLATGQFGKTRGCMFPANRPGDSAHNFGWAWDSVTPREYQPWWDHVRSLAGFSVPPNDRIHAEVPNWRNYR